MPTDVPPSPDIVLHVNLVRPLIRGCERPHLRVEHSVEITDALILDALRQEGMVPSRAAARLLEARRRDLEGVAFEPWQEKSKKLNRASRGVLTARINELRAADPAQLALI